MQEIAVVQGLKAQVIELKISFGFDGLGKTRQIKLQQLGIQQFVVYAFFHKTSEGIQVMLAHFSMGGFLTQHFLGDGIHQQTCSGKGIAGFFFNHGARCQHRSLVHFFHGDAVVQVAHGFIQDRRG